MAEKNSFETSGEPAALAELIIRPATLFWVTVVMGILGGMLAVPGVMATLYTTGHGMLFPIYIVVIGPVVEELLKPSGMLFLLRWRPFLIRTRWQFLLGAILGGLTFSILENLIYQRVFLAGFPRAQWREIMIYRWVVCTALHVVCSTVSGWGLLVAWRRSGGTEGQFRFRYVLPYLGAAIALHGIYNLLVTLFAHPL